VYNGEEFLEEAIESFLGQTFDDFELILADNASTDGTAEICRRAVARDSRIRFLPSEVNRGLAWNHNRAAAAARGDYFMWAPHDDRFAHDYIERCVAVLDADPEVVYCYGLTILTTPDGTILGREVPRFKLKARQPNVRFWEELIVHGGQNFYGMIRRSVLTRIAPHRTFPWAERVIFSELSLYGRFAVIDAPMYFRRVHPAQLSASRSDRVHEAIVLDPRRASRWRHNALLMRAEYVLAFFDAVRRSPLPLTEKLRCYARLFRWGISKVPGLGIRDPRTRGVVVEPMSADDGTSGGDSPGPIQAERSDHPPAP
jgi:glycosyltransferase involved in cell wall biosynthesis